MVERTLLQPEREFERRDDLRAPWMTGKAIDIFENQSLAAQNAGNRGRYVLLREWGDIPVKYDAEALRIDFPTHDAERFRPGVLAAHLNRGAAAVVGLKHTCSRAIAEQRRGDNIRLGQLIEPEGQGANFDRDEQNNTAWT